MSSPLDGADSEQVFMFFYLHSRNLNVLYFDAARGVNLCFLLPSFDALSVCYIKGQFEDFAV
jgi:hypothetical protein